MNLVELMVLLRENDITLSVAGDELVVRGANLSADSPLIYAVREQKQALVTLISKGGHSDLVSAIAGVSASTIPNECDEITPEMLPLVALDSEQIAQIVANVPGGAANIQDIYPLAPLQEGILFHYLLADKGDPYLSQVAYRFDSKKRIDEYLAALQAVIDRHDILRTSVLWQDLPEPLQVVWRRAQLGLDEVAVDPLRGDVAEQLIAQFDPRHFRLDVSHAPLMRVAFAHDSVNASWVLVHLFHHLALDHTALDLVQREIDAFLLGDEALLPHPVPFRTLVANARYAVSREEHEAYFRAILGDVVEPTLPFGLADTYGVSDAVEEAYRSVDSALAKRLREGARRLGVSAASICHVAWARVLSVVSSRDDVVFGTVLLGRMQGGAGSDRAVGLFMNALPLRVKVGTESAESCVRNTHDALARLLHHEHASLALAQRCSGVAAPAPLFSALFNYRHVSAETSNRVRAGIQVLRGGERTNYPLMLSVNDFGEDLSFSVQAHRLASADRVCGYMHRALHELIDALEQAPGTALRALTVLEESDRERLLVTWNATEAKYPALCVHELFEEQAARTPDATAITHSGISLNYEQLNARANQLAWRLRKLGVGRDSRVALCLDRGIDMVLAMLATLKAGGAYVPLDPSHPLDRLSFILLDSAPSVVLTHAALDQDLQGMLEQCGVSLVLLDTQAHLWADETVQNLTDFDQDPTDLAYVIYTSGSTGKPKGVMLEHGGVVNLLCAFRDELGVTQHDALLALTTYAFDISVLELFVPLISGARTLLIDREKATDGVALAKELADLKATIMQGTPATWRMLIESGWEGQPIKALCGGEGLALGLASQIKARVDGLWNVYGPTETTIWSTCHRVEDHSSGSGYAPIGRPIANTTLYVLNNRLEIVPVGVCGDLYIGGAGVARGYWNRAELTSQRFVASPFVEGERLYQTGDLVRYLHDGSMEFIGRSDFQVKIRGFRIELGEIESCLSRHPAVRESVVVSRDEGSDDKRLVAYYTCRGYEPTASEILRSFLTDMLPDYMIPAAFVCLDTLPLNASGKVDRKSLPAPEGTAFVRRAYEPPTGAIEIALAQIWIDLLKVEKVGRNDSFFELGGHSLLAVRMLSRVRSMLGADIPLRDLFAQPELKAVAANVGLSAAAALPPITAVDRGGAMPTSFAQQRLWLLGLMGKSYQMPYGLRLKGELDVDAFRRSLDQIVLRHESLRTTFHMEDGEPVQRVKPAAEFELLERDVSSCADPEFELGLLVEAESARPFSLAHGPLVRGLLVKVGDQERVFVSVMDHIISDGWSVSILLQELSYLYTAFKNGNADPLAPLLVQYGDFAVWQRRYLTEEALSAQAAYWKQTLEGAPTLLALPTDYARPPEQDHHRDYITVEFDEELVDGLRALSQRHGTTLYMTLLTAWGAILSRLSGQPEVIIGTPTANRVIPEVESLIGFFVNTLALRLDFTGAPTIAEALARVKEQALAAQQNQDLPFEQVVEMLRPPRSLAHAPIFQAMLAWENVERVDLMLPGIDATPFHVAPPVEEFDLTFNLTEKAGKVFGELGFASALFSKSSIQRQVEYFRCLLRHMVVDDAAVLHAVPILSAAEHEQLLVDWNSTERWYPDDRCIHHLFEDRVGDSPDAIAVIDHGVTYTYDELNQRANRLARHLRSMDVGPDARVAVLLPRGQAMVEAVLATLKAGGAYVPMDPKQPVARLKNMLDDCKASVVLTTSPDESLSPMLAGQRVVLMDAPPTALGEWSTANLADEGLSPDHLAFVMYTSGSTGQPKGVAMPHRPLVNLIYWQITDADYTRAAVTQQYAATTFDASFHEIFGALCSGSRLSIVDEDDRLGARLLDALEHSGIERAHVPYVALAHAIETFVTEQREDKLRSLRELITAGDRLVITEPIRAFFKNLGTCQLYNQYGPTETHVATAYTMPTDVESWPLYPSIGRPIPNTRIYILDEFLQPVPVGVTGELYIGGVAVARGYWNRPELTAQRFIANPFVSGDRLYKTGDLARYLPDGNIDFIGRNDFQVKIRGFRIELGEIEAALADHPDVRDGIVVARGGDAEKQLVAYFTCRGEVVPGVERLRSHLSSTLPDYMVPAAFVYLKALPINSSGKVDRNALPAPSGDAYAARAFEPPVGVLESSLARIWSDLFNIERVGRHDNFFDLGGHSLLAARMLSRIRTDYGDEIALRDLFAHPGLSSFALVWKSSSQSTLPAISIAERGDFLPLSYAQQRLWFLSQIDAVSEAYHIPVNLRIRGPLDTNALRKALDRIVARHEALRTTFPTVKGVPIQRIGSAEFVLELLEHDVSDAADAPQQLERLTSLSASTPFDLEAGPLIRGHLVKLSEEEHVLLLTMHHIVSDGWSQGVLVKELDELYQAFHSGQADSLEPLAIQYADYASWQRTWLVADILREQSDYWQQRLLGAPSLLELPTDYPRPLQSDFKGAAIPVEFDAAFTAKLKALSSRNGTTLFMTVLSGLGALLSRLSGQEEVVIGTPVANRRHAEFENLIGFFVNTIALRLNFAEAPTVRQTLEHVKRAATQALHHQDMPFEQVVEIVNPPRNLGHAPIFQVMFAWQNNESSHFGLAGLDVTPLGSPQTTAKFDLTLSLMEEDGRLFGGLEYATSLFKRETAERYVGYLKRLLAQMADNDAEEILRLDLLSPEERQRTLVTWNATEVMYAEDRCIHHLFEEQVERTPDTIAVNFEGSQITYAQLNAEANRLARYLEELTVGPEARVALCLERGLEMVTSILAVLKAGGAYVPLDPAYPLERLEYMLSDSAATVVLTHGDVAETVRASLRKTGAMVLLLDQEPTAWSRASGENRAQSALTPANLAYIIYTSGSTGQPKGVMTEHRALANRLNWMQGAFGLGAVDVVLQKTPFSFDVSVWEFFWPLLQGATLQVALPGGHKDAGYLNRIIDSQGVTTVHFVPSMLQAFLDHEGPGCPHVRRVFCSGESLPSALVQRFRQRFPQAELHNLYGPTEAAIDVTSWPCDTDDVPNLIPIGRPIANTRVYILDKQFQPVPLGVAGELFIGGVQVARGYWNRLELTAEKFIDSPFVKGDRLYRTGDMARYLPEGNIEYLGRNDFQVKIRGFRIELGEVESVIAGCNGVRDAVVVALEDGAGDKRLTSYYTTVDAAAIETEVLRQHVAAQLPEHMVPAAYVFLDVLPLTSSGKIDRKALPAPNASAFASGAYEAPQGRIEVALASIWSDLLGVERIGRNDNFFSLGGHSLLVVRVIDRLRSAGFHADVRTLFTAPTLVDLARAVSDEAATLPIPPNRIPPGAGAITPEMLPLIELTSEQIARIVESVPGGATNIQDIYPLTALQEGIHFHHLLAENGDPYLLSAVMRFDGRARVDAYLSALQSVIGRHDILRTAIAWEGLPEPVQIVWRHAQLVVDEIALSADDGEIVKQLVARFDPRTYRLDLREAPLMRVAMAQDIDGSWVLVHLFHHLALDHEALEIVEQEIDAHLRGDGPPLADPPQFRDVVANSRFGVSREEHEMFFREMLGDVTEPTLPFGLADVQSDGSEITALYYPVQPTLSQAVRESARKLGVSAASFCHVAWGRVLAAISSADDVVFGTVVFGRMQGGEGAGRVVGLSLNTLPMRITLGDKSVVEAIHATHETLAQLMHHEQAPLALAQRCSGVAAPTPLFSSLFNYRHFSPKSTHRVREGVEQLAGGERTNYPITLSVNDLGDGFSFSAYIHESVDASRICSYMEQALLQLVDAVEQAPDSQLRTLTVLPSTERQQLLRDWNLSKASYSADRCIHEVFEEQVACTPDAVALTYEEVHLSYAELNTRANRLANHLRAMGVGPDARVAVCMERSIELVVSILAVLKAGGGYVPLDPGYPIERLYYVIDDSAPTMVLTHRAVSTPVHTILYRGGVPVLDIDEDGGQWADASTDNLERGDLRPANLAYMIYTSGSTGLPKGVVIEHANVVRLFEATHDRFHFSESDVWTLFHSVAFDFSVWEIWGALFYGGRLVVVPRIVTRSPADFFDLLCAQRVTILNQTPSAFRELISAQGRSGRAHHLRHVIFGGEALDVGMLRPWHERESNQAALLTNMYGITETTVHVTHHEVKQDQSNSAGSVIGRRIDDLHVYILDALLEPVPTGIAGELYIGGAGVARGYWNRPEVTAERFIASPFVDGERLYKTGDLARYLPDGNIEYLGRNDFQVKIRGFRIELGEIESTLGTFPGVREAIVDAREDASGESRLIAYLTEADEEAKLDAEALRAYLLDRLPDYMVPAAYVLLESFPLTPSGKVDRRALPDPSSSAYAASEYEAPEGRIEEALARIWCEVLNVERTGRHDNFFALGGHSLLVVRAIELMRSAGLHADVRTLFTAPTLAMLAATVREEAAAVVVPPNGIPAGCTLILPEMLPLVDLDREHIERIVAQVPGGAANVQDIYPLTPLQEGIHFHHLLTEKGDPYLLNSVMRFDTRSRLDAYVSALQSVIDRHDILRTSVMWEGLPQAVQVVCRDARLVVEEPMLDPAAGTVVDQLSAQFDPRRYRLDLRHAPLMRVAVAPEPMGTWVLIHLFHHLVLDHEALEIIESEIGLILRGDITSLAEPLPFRTFVAHARLGVGSDEHEAFFSKMLGDVTEPTLPFGLADVRGDGSEVNSTYYPVDVLLADRARQIARKFAVSTASLCHVAWAATLSAISGRDDVVFGTVLFGRTQSGAGADRVVGLSLNTLPLRVSIVDASVAHAVRVTHDALAQLMHHEHASLAMAQRCSGVVAPAPLFSALLNYRHVSGEKGDRAIEGIEQISGGERTNYPVTMSVNDFRSGLSFSAYVHGSIDARRVCSYLHTALRGVVDALEFAPETGLETLAVIPEAEREQLLFEWNATEVAFPSSCCIQDLFEDQALLTPDAIAVQHGTVNLSFAELDARADRVAGHLRDLGVRPGDLVAVCMERGPELLASMLAIFKAGAAYVPMDPTYPRERLAYMLADSAACAVLAHGSAVGIVEELASGKTVSVVNLSNIPLQSEPSVNCPAQRALEPQDLAYVIYTSGSTGQPKGVMVEHRSCVNRILAQRALSNISEDARYALKSSIGFVDAFFEALVPLCYGKTLVVIPDDDARDVLKLTSDLRAQEISDLVTVPSLANVMISLNTNFSHLRNWTLSGEALTTALARNIRAALPHGRLINIYGSTEVTADALSYEFKENSVAFSVPIGRPIANTYAYILNKRLEPVPLGVSGELYIGGVQVARGYWRRPELTAERFVANPFLAEDRLFKTGDVARYLPDGNIEFLGRDDFQVKIRGFRIELGEVEAILSDYGDIRDAVVVLRDEHQGEKQLVAYCTVADNVAIEAEELRAHLLRRLPDYMVPAAYVFLQSFPLTTSGKIDRKALPAPDSTAFAAGAYESPQGDVEETLAKIWLELLAIDRVGRNDNFFSLGGHSLLAVRMLSRVREALHAEIALSEIFSHSQLKDFALCVRGAPNGVLPRIVPVEGREQTPLSYAQQRLWFLSQMEGVGQAYHIPMNLRMQGSIDVHALQRALNRIVARHEVLRTTFELADGSPVQRIGDTAIGFALTHEDLRGAESPWTRLGVLANSEAVAPFDLRTGPLIRGRLVQLGVDDHVLLLTMHHIISDGWSLSVFVRELGELYEAFTTGKPDPLIELEVQYSDYASWQRDWLAGDVVQRQRDYWLAQLRGAPALLELPTDKPRPMQSDFVAASVPVELDAKLTEQLKQFSSRHGATLFMTLLAGLGAVLSRLSGQDEVVVGAPVANRRQGQIENLIGFFVNTVALRLDYSGEMTASQLIERVKRQTVEAQQHQDLPFEQVVELLSPVRSLAHSPIFQVMFAWQNNDRKNPQLGDLAVSAIGTPYASAKFDLTLNLAEENGCIRGSLEYAAALFEPTTVLRYVGYFQRLLAGLVDPTSENITSLELMPQSERDRIVIGLNETSAEYSTEQCVHQLFEAQAALTPDSIALEFEDAQVTYAELNKRANQLARHLRSHGVGPETRVALCFERCVEMVVSLLAVLKAGAAYIPLDPSSPLDRIASMITDCEASVVLTHSPVEISVQAIFQRKSTIVLVDKYGTAFADEGDGNLSVHGLTFNSLAYILYTSGSTGQPKGVMTEHGALSNRLHWMQARYGLSPGDVVLQKTAVTFDVSVWELMWPLLTGATLLLARPDGQRDVAYLSEVINERAVTTLHFVPSMLQVFLDHDISTHPHVRRIICSGETLTSALVRRFSKRFPRAELHNLYGPTEAAIDVTSWQCPLDAVPDVIPIGSPIANTRIYILDANLKPVPFGVGGELHIGGVQVARGYWNRPTLTAERFIPSPFVPGDRLYKTGDLARYQPDGNIEYLGRNDFQVKLRGFRIELGEIEAAMLSYLGVRNAVVVLREDAPGEKRLVAYYNVASDQPPLDAVDLRSKMLTQLPEYMVPSAFVLLETMPLTSSGKVDRKALPVPVGDAFAALSYEPPQGNVEETLASIWSQVLGIDRIGRCDNFFALGGHSLLLVNVIERMRAVDLYADVRLLFTAPTLADLAAAANRESGASILVPENLIPLSTDVITPEMLTLWD